MLPVTSCFNSLWYESLKFCHWNRPYVLTLMKVSLLMRSSVKCWKLRCMTCSGLHWIFQITLPPPQFERVVATILPESWWSVHPHLHASSGVKGSTGSSGFSPGTQSNWFMNIFNNIICSRIVQSSSRSYHSLSTKSKIGKKMTKIHPLNKGSLTVYCCYSYRLCYDLHRWGNSPINLNLLLHVR